LFLGDERHSFLGISAGSKGEQPSPLKGVERKSALRAIIFRLAGQA